MNESEFKIFVDLVKQMRHNQKRYNRFQKPEIRETLNAVEKEVDEIINKLTDSQLNIWNL